MDATRQSRDTIPGQESATDPWKRKRRGRTTAAPTGCRSRRRRRRTRPGTGRGRTSRRLQTRRARNCTITQRPITLTRSIRPRRGAWSPPAPGWTARQPPRGARRQPRPRGPVITESNRWMILEAEAEGAYSLQDVGWWIREPRDPLPPPDQVAQRPEAAWLADRAAQPDDEDQ